MKTLRLLLILTMFLSGCATLNFSSKYYTLPDSYNKDIEKFFEEIKTIPLKNSYTYKICKDNETSPLSGVPQITGTLIMLPDLFVKYVYQYHYNDRKSILTYIMLHEIAHVELGISDKPPETHYLCDKAVFDYFKANPNFLFYANDVYSSLCVLENYWYARKGIGGNLANVTFMAVNITSSALFGVGYLADLYETDLSTRLQLFRNEHPNTKFVFKRSRFSKNSQ